MEVKAGHTYYIRLDLSASLLPHRAQLVNVDKTLAQKEMDSFELVAISHASAAKTYWAFPAGKTCWHFRVDENACRQSFDYEGWNDLERCLEAKGYAQVSREKARAEGQRFLSWKSNLGTRRNHFFC